MNKRRLHHYWRHFKHLKPWHFLALALLFTILAVASLRSNYQHMVTLRAKVYAADQAGGDVQGSLNDLRRYVNAHMNTSLATKDGVYPPIQLKYTYDRLVQAESAQVAGTNSALYTQAQQYCQQQDSVDFSGRNRVPCISQYVNDHGAKQQSIPDALYKFDFASPKWSPDLAGWSLAGLLLSLLMAGGSYIIGRFVRS